MATHKLHTIVPEGDLFVAHCLGCSWVSEGFDTRKEAKDAHLDHVLSERVKG